MSLFQSNFREQIRNLPKIENSEFCEKKLKIHYYSKLFTSLLGLHHPRVAAHRSRAGRDGRWERSRPRVRRARAGDLAEPFGAHETRHGVRVSLRITCKFVFLTCNIM